MMRLYMLCGVLSLSLFACNSEKKKEEPPKVQEAPQPKKVEEKKVTKKKKSSTITLSPDTPKTKLEIPTVAELEDEAAKRIKPENLESELDRLEAEIVDIAN